MENITSLFLFLDLVYSQLLSIILQLFGILTCKLSFFLNFVHLCRLHASGWEPNLVNRFLLPAAIWHQSYFSLFWLTIITVGHSFKLFSCFPLGCYLLECLVATTKSDRLGFADYWLGLSYLSRCWTSNQRRGRWQAPALGTSLSKCKYIIPTSVIQCLTKHRIREVQLLNMTWHAMQQWWYSISHIKWCKFLIMVCLCCQCQGPIPQNFTMWLFVLPYITVWDYLSFTRVDSRDL